MEINKIIQGDCLEKLKELEENSVDSIVTDPPYNLSSIKKRFGKMGSAPAKYGKDGSFNRLSKGFMGKEWDNEVAFSPEVWQECLRVLKPGGHLLSFGGTRTYHRMACAIEDTGFEVRDMIEWVYGSGFPKSHNIGKAVDKLQGNKREVVGKKETKDFSHHKGSMMGKETTINNKTQTTTITETKGTSKWEGWGTALKPAHEPIVLARKPISEKTVAENVLKHGTGGINIDGSRVGVTGARFNGRKVDSDIYGKYGTSKPKEDYNKGRFPVNLIHDNSEEVRECFPETGKAGNIRETDGITAGNSIFGIGDLGKRNPKITDDNGGNASRFFKSIIYQAKASKKERNKGCEGLYWLEGKQITKEKYIEFEKENKELEDNKKHKISKGCIHPTVKTVALMEYLIKMITPKGGIVLDPFAGSGSTLVAAKQNGFNFIGIEMEEDYIKIAEAKVKAVKRDNKLF